MQIQFIQQEAEYIFSFNTPHSYNEKNQKEVALWKCSYWKFML